MGEFLQHDWLVRGDSRAIALCNTISETPYITCKPLKKGDNIFWLHATILDVQEGQCVYTVDYDTMHKHLGHPSRGHQQSAQFLVTFLDFFAFSQGKKVKRSQSFDLFPKSLLQLIDKIILFKSKNLNLYYFYYYSLIPTF